MMASLIGFSLPRFWSAGCFRGHVFARRNRFRADLQDIGCLELFAGALLPVAALTFVSLVERGVPFAVAFVITFAVMVVLGITIERAVLRPHPNKPAITLFMATLGLSYIIEEQPSFSGARRFMGLILVSRTFPSTSAVSSSASSIFFAALVAAGMVAILSAFFRYTPHWPRLSCCRRRPVRGAGRRSQAAWIWASVWAAAGLVALVAGCSGARGSGCNSRCRWWCSSVAVLVLGGFDSIVGAIIGGLVIGASEKLAEVYIGEYFGGGIEGWFAYVVALAFPADPPIRPVRSKARGKG